MPLKLDKGWFTYNNHSYYNNDSRRRPQGVASHVETSLPLLDKLWYLIEEATGYDWRNTSFLRESPSHKRGDAIDLVPVMDEDLKAVYAGTHGSDPVLHSRQGLIQLLRKLEPIEISPFCDAIIAIESDHLHVQLVKKDSAGPNPVSIYRWAMAKPVYKDTVSRNKKWERIYQDSIV